MPNGILALASAASLAICLAAQDSRPAPAAGTKEALVLAKKVKDFAGGAEGLAQVENVVFTFMGVQRVFWSCCDGKVRVENLSEPPAEGARSLGVRWDVLVHDCDAGADLLQSPPPPAKEAPRMSGKSMWINHTYWLLAPLKVLDDGVTLAIDPPDKDDAKGTKRLRLSFAGVGITPQNQYVLHVEEATGKLLRWDYYKNDKSAPLSWRFDGWKQCGPLKLALEHPPVDPAARGARGIELTDVAVNVKAPDDVWTSTKRILAELR